MHDTERRAIAILTITIILLIGLIFALIEVNDRQVKERGFFENPGNCPTCGEPLVKGVYGSTGTPRFCWYCPICP